MNEKNLCWIGYITQLRALKAELTLAFGLETDTFRNAKDGLEAIAKKDYPLILVNDIVPAGYLELPDNISLDDGHKIGSYVIQKIREQDKVTPIIVNHCGSFIGYRPEKAIKMYLDSGATECFDWYGPNDSLGDFSRMIGKHLKISRG